MRLLHRDADGKVTLTSHFGKDAHPPYAILSHTWGEDEDEATFEDFCENKWAQKIPGAKKIRMCADQAARDGLHYCWVDTCCIDKSSSAELQEAINSMYQWYQHADKCYVYLSDNDCTGPSADNEEMCQILRRSRWWTRGWTVQELLAPPYVHFYSAQWTMLGTKLSLARPISQITGIPLSALRGLPLSQFSVQQRLGWGAKRNTKRKEDAAYCLLGLFDVQMPLLYGEGKHKALRRLKVEIESSTHYLPPSLVPSGKWKSSELATGNIQEPLTRQSKSVTVPLRSLQLDQHSDVLTRDDCAPRAASALTTKLREHPRHHIAAHNRVIVSCNHDASELSVSQGGNVRTIKLGAPLLKADGDMIEAAMRVKAHLAKLPPETLGQTVLPPGSIELIWTAPLMASDAGKMRMRDAARSAGFRATSRVVPQIHAAVSPVMHREYNNAQSKRAELQHVRPDRARKVILVVLCDATGCEIAAYAVDKASGKYEEATTARAVTAGWTALEDGLRDWMASEFGSAFTQLDPQLSDTASEFVKEFRRHIAMLDKSSSKWQQCHLSLVMQDALSTAYDASEGKVILGRERLLSLIESSINNMIVSVNLLLAILKKQHQQVSQVKLMGSFADIPCIRAAMTDKLQMITNGRIAIEHERNASVTSGAILQEEQGLKPTSTKALRSYGTLCSMPFREGIDPMKHKYYNAYYDMHYCSDRVAWVLKKGDTITSATAACSRHTLTIDFRGADQGFKVRHTTRFLTCGADELPDWAYSQGVDKVSSIIETELTRNDFESRSVTKNGVHGLKTIVQLSLGSDAGVLEARLVDARTEMPMGTTSIRFE